MDNSLKALLIAAGIIVTCFVIGMAFYLSRIGNQTFKTNSESLVSIGSSIEGYDLAHLDNKIVSGSQILTLLVKDAERISIKTNASNDYFNGLEDGIYDTTNGCYVKPDAEFLGSIVRDGNDTFSGIKFKQVSEGGTAIGGIENQGTIDFLTGKLNQLNKLIDQLKGSNSELEALKKDLEDRLDATADYDSQVATKEQSQKDLDAVNRELESVKKDLADVQSIKRGLESTLSRLKTQLNNLTAERDSWKSKAIQLQIQLDSLNKQLSDLLKELETWKNKKNNFKVQRLTGSIGEKHVVSVKSVSVGGGTFYEQNCGKEGSNYYYDLTLNRRLNDLSKVTLALRLTSHFSPVYSSGMGGMNYYSTTAPEGKLYNNTTGNTVLRLYANWYTTGWASGYGSWDDYYVKNIEYNVLYASE